MKKNKKYNKLSLNKISITRLTNSHKIWGGTGVVPGDGDGTDKGLTVGSDSPKKPKCVNNSQDFAEE